MRPERFNESLLEALAEIVAMLNTEDAVENE